LRQVSIVKLLEWAYRQELPKAERPGGSFTGAASSSWGMVADYGVLGTVIDAPVNRWGVVPVHLESGNPHPDAMMVARAVAVLDGARVHLPDGWTPFPEWADSDGLVAETVARLRARLVLISGAEIQTMLIARAVLGRTADWRGEEPGRVMIMRGGKPAWFMKVAGQDAYGNRVDREVDGSNRRSHRPYPGAYRKYRLIGDVEGLVIDRFRRTVWALAVRHIASTVAGQMVEHELTAEVPTLAPWAVVSGMAGQADPLQAMALFV